MAPVNPKFKVKNTNKKHGRGPPGADYKNMKNKWNPGNKFFHGSVPEGQGFAFKRKLKTQQQYKKLQRKEKWRTQNSDEQFSETYPEHLKHLYLAEQERLNHEEQMKRDGRAKTRKADAANQEDRVNSQIYADSGSISGTAASTSGSSDDPQTQSVSDQMSQKKWRKMSSYQRMQEEYKRKKEERERKQEAYLKDKEEREEALKKYKEKKIASYQLLKKKTKKGQPNLNLQMELLLQKIQAQNKK